MDQARVEGPIRQAIDAVDKRLQGLNEKIVLLEGVLAPAVRQEPTKEKENPSPENPGQSELAIRLWHVEDRLAFQNQGLDRLIDLLEI